ncbi:MAG: hypothetical protein K6G74_02700 [Bacilli bacterium]|nr:hypothetical protein [Bacilli bacterium]
MKKLTSVTLLSFALLLSACKTDTPIESTEPADSVDSTSSVSDSTPASESEPELTLEQKAKALFTNLAATNNGTFHSAMSKFTEYHFENGMLHILDTDARTDAWGYGEAKIKDYGIAQFLYTNDTVGVDTENAGILSPNANITYKEYNHVLADLGESGKNITFTIASRSKTFSTDDSEFITSLLWLNGIDLWDDVSDEFTGNKAYFNLTEDGKSIEKFGVTLGKSKSGDYYDNIKIEGATLTSIGTTTANAKVDAYIKSNPTFTAASAWDADTLAYIAESAGTVSFSLPFPTGTSYAYSMPVDEENRIIYTDLGSGNKNTSYGQQLIAAGFTLDTEESDPSKNAYFYTKTLAPAQGVHGEKIAYVGMVYSAATDEALTTIYPNGIWRVFFFVEQEAAVENVTLADVNAEFASKKLLSDQTAPILPTLTLAEGCTQIDFIDGTDTFIQTMMYIGSLNGFNVSFQYAYSVEAHFHYPEASSEAAIASLSSQLLAAGYANVTDENGATDPTTFSKDDGQTGARLIVSLDKAMSEATQTAPAAYEGYINLSVSHYKMTVTQ